VEIGAVYNGSCKPQSCQKQKDKYSTAKRVWEYKHIIQTYIMNQTGTNPR